MIYTDSKNALIYANCDDSKIFFAIERGGKYFSFEYSCYDIPACSFCEWKDKQEFIQSIEWHDWIIAGIKDENLMDEVIKYNLFDKEEINGK